jgi:hypothetical protein
VRFGFVSSPGGSLKAEGLGDGQGTDGLFSEERSAVEPSGLESDVVFIRGQIPRL